MIAFVLTMVLAGGTADLTAAERAYEARHYEEAQLLYTGVLAEARVPAEDVLYNLGNCAFRRGRYAEAAWHYRRALHRDPWDGEAAFNLGLAQERIGIEGNAPGRFEVAAARVRSWTTPGQLLAVLGVVQAAGVLALVVARRRTRRLAGGLLIVLALAGGVVLLAPSYAAPVTVGVVLEEGVELRATPGPEGSATATLAPGLLVRLVADEGGWVRVEHPRGSGWTAASGVGVVD